MVPAIAHAFMKDAAHVDGQSDVNRRLRRYLLGDLVESDQAVIEQEYFADDDAFERLVEAENDLIDAYVAAELSAEERARFEQVFLTTAARRERVAFARSLRHAAAAPPVLSSAGPSRSPWRDALAAWQRFGAAPRWAMAAAGIVLVGSLSWLTIERARLQDAVDRLQVEQTSVDARARDLQQQLDAERRRADDLAAQRPPAIASTTPVVVSFLLTTGGARDLASGQTLRLPANATMARLELQLDADSHRQYQPVLQTADGEEVWRQRPAPAQPRGQSQVVVLELPASLLANADYVLMLNGQTPGSAPEEVAAYSFRVTRP
jgi:hypothetical protein